MKASAFWLLGFLTVIWAVELANGLMGHQLSAWGILPRTSARTIPALETPLNQVVGSVPLL